MTYSPNCVALYKLTNEFERFYEGIKMEFRFVEQHPPYGPYRFKPTDPKEFTIQEMPNLVYHRLGTHNFDPEWVRFVNIMIRERRITGYSNIYFLDDYLIYMNDYLPIKIIQRCDKVITLGYFLKPHLEEKYGLNNVTQLKTHIDWEQYEALPKADANSSWYNFENGKFNMVWFSMVRTGLGLMELLFEKLSKMPEAKDLCFWCITPQAAITRLSLSPYRKIDARFIEFVPPKDLAVMEKSSDLIINPIHMETDNKEFVPEGEDRSVFMNAKSEIKYIHSGAAKTPLLTSKSLPYEKTIKHGENGFMSDDVDEWIEIILRLKDDSEEGRGVAEKAHEDIKENYDPKTRFEEYMNLITEVNGG